MAGKTVDRLDDAGRLLVREPGLERKGQQLGRRRRCHRARRGNAVGERALIGERERVVNQGLHAGRQQVRPQRVALPRADWKEVIDVTRVALEGNRHRRREQPAIKASDFAPPARGRRKADESRAQDGSLQLVEPAVDARFDVVMPRRLTAVAHPAHLLGDVRIVGDDRAAVAERPEVLGRVEAERAAAPAGADRPFPRTVARCA